MEQNLDGKKSRSISQVSSQASKHTQVTALCTPLLYNICPSLLDSDTTVATHKDRCPC